MSSLLYTVAPNNQAATDAFRDRKLSQYRAESVGNLQVSAFSAIPRPLADTVLGNLIDFADAQISSQAKVGYRAFRPIFSRVSSLPYVDPPVAYFKFDQLSGEAKSKLAGFGLEEDNLSKMWRGVPLAHTLPDIFKLGAHDGRNVPGAASAYGFLAYTMGLKAVKIFSSMSVASKGLKRTICFSDGQEFGGPKDMSTQTAIFSGLTAASGTATHLVPPLPRTTVFQCEENTFIYQPVIDSTGLVDYTINTAYKSSESGCIFPYFNGMVLPDREFCSQIFQRFFFRGLGPDGPSSARLWQKIKQGFRNISLTRGGMALSHMFLGIMMADMSKGFLRVMIEGGVYHGFVIMGSHCRFIINNTLHEPMEKDIFNSLMPTMSSSPVALVKLLNLLRVPTDEDGSQRYATTGITTSRGLFELLSTVVFSDFTDGQNKEILDYIDQISFDEPPTPISYANLLVFLNFVATGDVDILRPFPAFLKQQTYKSSDRVTIGLTMFGYSVPSISYGQQKKGIRLVLPKEGAEDDLLNKGYPSMPIRAVPFGVGVVQWTGVFSRQEILLPAPNPKKIRQGFADFSETIHNFTGPNLEVLYTKIKTIANLHRIANEGKRKRGLEIDASESKRRRHTAGDELEYI